METTRYLATYRVGDIYTETGDGTQYLTASRHGISMVKVAEIHYAELLRKRCGCCDQYHPCFREVSQAEIDLWNSPE